jgi:hypothetical protein
VVAEDEVANHAGHSVWADEDWLYVNLNQSFLGVAFEAEGSDISPAQMRSGAMLVEMLRHRYRISSSNFVTHAQVSVNPSNMRVGAHVDWASGFPFRAMGLEENYSAPLPAVWAFGFDCDEYFISKAELPLRTAIGKAESLVAQRASAAGLKPEEYKQRLRQRYREILAKVSEPHSG